MKIYLEKKAVKSILVLLMGMGVTACSIPSEEEEVAKFNQANAPEYQIIDRILYIDWKADSKRNAPPLKLKVPMSYIDKGLDEKGRIGNLSADVGVYGPFDYTLSKDPKEKPVFGAIPFRITESSQPVPVNNKGDALTQEVDYVFDIIEREIKGRPVASRLINDRGEKAEDIFRVKDVNGLQHYKSLSCYDVEELKKDVQLKRMGYKASQVTLDRLANKAADDPTPKNCISNELDQFWISPPEVPDNESVGIYCGTTANCEIKFRYKSRNVSIITHENRFKVIPRWQTYIKQVIQTIQQFETQ